MVDISRRNLSMGEVPESLPNIIPWRLFSFSIILLVALFVIYAAVSYVYVPSLQKDSQTIDKEIVKLNDQFAQFDQKRISDAYSKLSNLKTLLDNHPDTESAFLLLEGKTIPRVFYTKAIIDIDRHGFSLDAETDSLSAVAQQVSALELSDKVAEVLVKNVQKKESGRIAFQLLITLKKKF